MLQIVVAQYVMPPVEVEEEAPPVWYDEDTLVYGEAWRSTYSLSGSLGYTYGSYADLSGMSVKGGHPKGTAVLLNGVLVNQPQGGWADLSDLSLFLFPRAEVWEGGTTPYSIYGNLNLSYVPDTVGYLEVGSKGTARGGVKWGSVGGEGGLATRGRDSLLYAEGVWDFGRGFLDVRVSRKRTSGMEGFPQTAGVQGDVRVLLGSRWGNVLLLRRTWKDWSGYYRHDNLRFSRDLRIYGLTLGGALEGVRSTNVGNRLRPLLSLGKEHSRKWMYVGGGLWWDGRRVGYSSVVGLRRWMAYAEVFAASRIPSFDELYWEGYGARGNPNLRNERSLGVSAGVVHRYVRLDLYFRRLYDLIEWRPSGGVWRPDNVGAAKVWGGEVKVEYGPFLLRYVRMWAYDDEGRRLIYRPRNSYYLRLSPRIRSVSLTAEVTYLDPRFTNPENTRFVGHVLLANVGVSLNWGRVSVGLLTYNVLNGRYYFVEGYPLPGRTFSLRAYLQPQRRYNSHL